RSAAAVAGPLRRPRRARRQWYEETERAPLIVRWPCGCFFLTLPRHSIYYCPEGSPGFDYFEDFAGGKRRRVDDASASISVRDCAIPTRSVREAASRTLRNGEGLAAHRELQCREPETGESRPWPCL